MARARVEEIRGLRKHLAGANPILPRELEILELFASAAAQGDAKGLGELRRAAALEDQLPPPSGPAFALSAHERLGEQLLRTGKPREAAAEFGRALSQHPGRARSLLGAARAAAQGYDPASATAAYQQLLATWDHADPSWPGLAEARGQSAR